MIKYFFTAILCITFCLQFASLQAVRKKPFFKSEEEADCYLEKHYALGCKYYNAEEYRHAASEFEKVTYFFPSSDDAAKAFYYLAVCYFEMREYDFANKEFSNYLKASAQPEYFEDAVHYKFCIAERFKFGKKKRPFSMRYFPKWVSAQDLALTIYDEVIAALPNHCLTIQALYAKADLLRKRKEFHEAVETYQTIIRRFPKDEIVPACYVNIGYTYLQQSCIEFQNPDLLGLADLNLRKFKEDFPRDERIVIAEDTVCRIRERFARGLSDLGSFYERMNQIDAAAIYYQSAIEEFPDTQVSQYCRSRLICLGYYENSDEEGPKEATASPINEELSENASEPTLNSAQEANSAEINLSEQITNQPVPQLETDRIPQIEPIPNQQVEESPAQPMMQPVQELETDQVQQVEQRIGEGESIQQLELEPLQQLETEAVQQDPEFMEQVNSTNPYEYETQPLGDEPLQQLEAETAPALETYQFPPEFKFVPQEYVQEDIPQELMEEGDQPWPPKTPYDFVPDVPEIDQEAAFPCESRFEQLDAPWDQETYPNQTEVPRYFWHYSQCKKRPQRVNPPCVQERVVSKDKCRKPVPKNKRRKPCAVPQK